MTEAMQHEKNYIRPFTIAVGSLKSKASDMRGGFRAFPAGKATFHEEAAGRLVYQPTSE